MIAYAFRDSACVEVAHSINATMLRTGMGYPLAYDTQPEDHRTTFATLARCRYVSLVANRERNR